MSQNLDNIISRANKLRLAGDHEGCLSLLAEGRFVPGTDFFDRALFLRADAYCDRGDFLSALHCYSQLIGHAASDIAYNNRGLCLRELGRLKEALEDYKKAVQMNPTNVIALRSAADICIRLELPHHAKDLYSKAASVDPTDSRHYAGWGMACFMLEEWAEAYAMFTKALEVNPKDPIALKGTRHMEGWVGI